MKIPVGKTPLGILEQQLGRSKNPGAEADSKKMVRRLTNLLVKLPSYFQSIHEINDALDQALSSVGLKLRHYIDQAIPYGQSRQFLLETSDPNIIIAVQVYRMDSGSYELTSYATHDSHRMRSRRKNPAGDYEDDVAHFIAHVIAPQMREGESLVFPLPGGRGVRVHCAERGGQRAWWAEIEDQVYSEKVIDGEAVRETQIVRSGNTEPAYLLEDLENNIHQMLHEAAEMLHSGYRPRMAGNPGDEEPTELPGEDIDAGIGEEMPRIVDIPEEADRIYEEFHGQPSGEEILAEEEIQIRENLGVLGRLVQIVCECVANGQAYRINFSEDVMLCASADGRQLYIVGGDQSLDLEAMGFNSEQQQKDKVFIGPAQQVTYRTRKHFDDFAEIDYVHDFGEDGGALPALIYDRLNQVIEFAGGDYEIKPEGIVN